MAGINQEPPCWTLYPLLLSTLKQEQDYKHLEEAAMAHQCGRYADAKALFEHKLPPSSSIPLLAMQRADMLTTQGVERERIQLLKATLRSFNSTDDGHATMEYLLLELMLLDASYWASGKMEGLLDKALQVRTRICQVEMDKLSDLEASFIS